MLAHVLCFGKVPIPVSFTGDKAQGGRLLVSAGRVSTPWATRQAQVLLHWHLGTPLLTDGGWLEEAKVIFLQGVP